MLRRCCPIRSCAAAAAAAFQRTSSTTFVSPLVFQRFLTCCHNAAATRPGRISPGLHQASTCAGWDLVLLRVHEPSRHPTRQGRLVREGRRSRGSRGRVGVIRPCVPPPPSSETYKTVRERSPLGHMRLAEGALCLKATCWWGVYCWIR